MIVGVSGKAKVGKDTMADFLVKRYGFVKVGFADPIKRVCQGVFGFTDHQLWGPSDERDRPDLRFPIPGKGHLVVRVPLQTLGDWARDLYQDAWVDLLLSMVDPLLSGTHRYDFKKGLLPNRRFNPFRRKPVGIVVPDVRFPNELKRLRTVRKDVAIIRVKRLAVVPQSGIVGHKSETDQDSIPDDEFDAVITNTGTDFIRYYTDIDMTLFKLPVINARIRQAA